MSVILDALRRARRGQDAHPGRPLPRPAPRVPAGLGLAMTPPIGARPARTRWVAIVALIVIVLGAWAAVQVARRLGVSDTTPAPQSTTTRPSSSQEPTARAAPITPRAVEAPPSSAPPATPLPPPAAALPRARAADTEPSAARHFDQAVAYHARGKLDEAAKQYLAAIAQDDRNLEAHNNLGLLYRSRGEDVKAVEQFRRALAIDPRYVTARNHLAVLLIDAGRFAEARRELNDGLALDPRNIDLVVNLALVEKGERHDERAMELLLRAVGDRPAHAAAHYNLALLYDQRRSFALAYDHYTDFLAYAGPEYGAAIADVRRRLQALAPLLDTTAH